MKCDLQPSLEWVDNQWIDLKKNTDLAIKLVLSDGGQGLDIVNSCSSLLSDNFSAYVEINIVEGSILLDLNIYEVQNHHQNLTWLWNLPLILTHYSQWLKSNV